MLMKKFALATSIFAVGAIATLANAATTVTVNGSTTVLPAMQIVAENFMKANPDVQVTISGTGSGNGIKALRDKMTDIAMSSRDVEPKEVADFKKHGITAVRFVVAHDAIVPVVNPNNPVKALTKEQLRDVFAGKIRTWKELGGADKPIVVIGRDSSSGTFESFQELVMGKKTRVSPRALLQSSNGGVVQAVATNPYAIGYVGIGYLDKQTHPLSINGVTASLATAKDKTWPISRDLYLFTSGQPTGGVKKLIDYMLTKEGQQGVVKAGYVPVTE